MLLFWGPHPHCPLLYMLSTNVATVAAHLYNYYSVIKMHGMHFTNSHTQHRSTQTGTHTLLWLMIDATNRICRCTHTFMKTHTYTHINHMSPWSIASLTLTCAPAAFPHPKSYYNFLLTLTYLLFHSFTDSIILSLTHSLCHSLTHLFSPLCCIELPVNKPSTLDSC